MPSARIKIYNKRNLELARKFFSKFIEKGLYFPTDFTVSEMQHEALLETASEHITENPPEIFKDM